MKVFPLVLICTLTACWYSSSSKNAVATQHLVEEMGGGSSPLPAMVVLTALQLLIGLCISWPLYQYLLSSGGSSPVQWKTQNKVILGALHFLGGVCTNLGFALGSASVVQVIKLMEPIETLILTALANVLILKVSHGLTVMKTISVVTIVSGTAMLLSQKRESDLGHQVNLGSVFFALCSGFAMASRNVFMKTSSPAATPSRSVTDNASSRGWRQVAVNGLFNYISITSAAAVPGTLFLILVESQGSSQRDSAITAWMFKSQVGKEAIVFHGLYNIASISVLCLISTQSHSLLNVGKRIVNVLYAGIVFRESIGFDGIRGLCIAGMGGILYSSGRNMTKTSAMRIYFAILVMILSSTLVTKNEVNIIFGSHLDPVGQWGSSPSIVDVSTSKYVVWMFPYPPPAKNMRAALSRDETLICAYSHACGALKNHVSIDLRDLTQGTYYHNYVRDHAYFKFRHMNDFPYHIQAITLLGLLKSNRANGSNVCVRTLGGNQEFCDDAEFKSYDPYDGVELNSTNFPYALLSDSKSKDREQMALAPREIMLAEKFATWGVGDIDVCQYYNSGEDVQSYAAATWLPFISELRDKVQAIRDYNGYYIGNALMSSNPFNVTEEDFDNMHKIHLTSIYSTEQGVEGMEDYLRNYTENVHPFGCRSLLTDRLLKQRKIKSYFSACLTLTTNMQGAILDDQHEDTQYRYILNEILKPDAKELPNPKQRNKIIFVDVQDPKVVPKSVWESEDAIHFTADVVSWYPNCKKKLDRYSYAYKLLSTYANQAKVLITSRIHAGLPAVGLGIPVIFVEGGPERSNWLPGGAQRAGRVEGLLDVFHRVQRGQEGKNWTFGDLTGDVPHSDGVHLADRYRASFWNRLKKTHYYRDTGKLFGMIPMQRLGRKNVNTGVQEVFHFVLESKSDLSWRTKRAIEHIFYFHPNCRVIVHSNQITATDLEIFVETGYNLVVQPYNLDLLLKEEDSPYKLRDADVIKISLPLLLLRKYGGLYVSNDTFLLKTIPADLEEGLVLQENGKPSIAFFDRDSKDALGSLKSIRSSGLLKANDRLSWSVPALSDVDTLKCMEDTEWSLPDDSKETIAVSLHPSSLASSKTIKIDTECYRFVEKLCIFCDEIHWDYD